jgi:esterase/lipase superfamily enzyme
MAPVLFTWPSKGKIYDRDSSIYSRDALEKVLHTLADDPRIETSSPILMGQFSMLSLDRAALD